MIRVGIMGCAKIARRSLIPAFAKHNEFQLKMIASRTLDTAAQLSANYNCRAGSYADLVNNPEIDLIYCPLPTGLHYEWVKKALLANKHVLCEKSLACSYNEVSDLVNTARTNACFLMESFQFRFHSQNLFVKELLSKNAIGQVRQLVIRFGIPPFPEGVLNIRYSKELGGGALLDNGAYVVKCATYLLGKNIKILAAMEGGRDPALGNVPLTGSIMMSSGDISVQASYGFNHFYQNSYDIWGEKGRIFTTRAFTAREDFAAPVTLETEDGKVVRSFVDDHFAGLLDYVEHAISSRDFEPEYDECLLQSKLLEASHDCAVRQ